MDRAGLSESAVELGEGLFEAGDGALTAAPLADRESVDYADKNQSPKFGL